MPSKVSICSNALLRLGDNPISSFDDATDGARLASQLWETVRDSVLRAHPWNCAIKRVSLAPKTDAPVYGFTYAFTLPSDCLRLLDVDTDYDYTLEGRDILAEENPLYVRYVYRNEDATTYDSLLVDALTARLTAEFAYPITKSGVQAQTAWTLYTATLKLARAVDAQETPPETLGDFPLINIRG